MADVPPLNAGEILDYSGNHQINVGRSGYSTLEDQAIWPSYSIVGRKKNENRSIVLRDLYNQTLIPVSVYAPINVWNS